MSRYEDGLTSKKIDVILGGMETIGSAERSTDVDMMSDTSHNYRRRVQCITLQTIPKRKTEAELEKFLEFDFERVGGGIGMTRMIAALETLDNDDKWQMVQ